MGFFFNLGYNKLPNHVERDRNGNYFYSFINGLFGSNKGISDTDKLETVLYNPAVLKVVCFIADVFSQVKIDKYRNNELVEKDFIYSYKKTPNEWQTWTDLFYDHRFNLAIFSTAYLYVQNGVFYYLRKDGLNFTTDQIKSFSELTFGANARKRIMQGTFKYKQANEKEVTLELKNLYVFHDLSSGVTGNWMESSSRLDALYQIAINSDLALTSKGTNLKYTEKFLISGNGGEIGNPLSPLMSDSEKDSISDSIENGRKVNATKSKVDMQQMVSNIKQLALDESWESDLLKIGSIFNLSKDVVAIIAKGSTYDNYDKAILNFIGYFENPKVQQFTDGLEVILGEEDLRGNFNHLPCYALQQVDKINNQKTELESLKIAQELGMDSNMIKDKLKEIYGY